MNFFAWAQPIIWSGLVGSNLIFLCIKFGSGRVLGQKIRPVPDPFLSGRKIRPTHYSGRVFFGWVGLGLLDRIARDQVYGPHGADNYYNYEIVGWVIKITFFLKCQCMNLVSSDGLLEYHFELRRSIWIFLNSLFVICIINCLDFAPQLLHPNIKIEQTIYPWKASYKIGVLLVLVSWVPGFT